ncbi:hypothetical protein [Streptomyces sp. Da 82-17]|uniref:hypothetical protein n=1 Tax=Streptomyces sp. Da 82-17 TaxID=3377116 RepID=UPI0038D3B9AE
MTKVERTDSEPVGYGCYPDDWELQINAKRESTEVDLRPDDPEVTVRTAEPLQLHRDQPGVPATDALFFGVFASGPTDLAYHFTVEVTVRDGAGRRFRYTLDDAGRPFVLAARPDNRAPEDEKHVYEEIGHRIG